jgi:hypothetical protein
MSTVENTGQPGVVTRAADLSAKIRETTRRSPFERAVDEFRRLLHTIPDHAVGELPPDAMTALSASAEQVIDCIENRISSGADSASTQLALARAVYSIRGSLEGMDRWRRHYARVTDAGR